MHVLVSIQANTVRYVLGKKEIGVCSNVLDRAAQLIEF